MKACTRVDLQSLSIGQDLPRSPQSDGSPRMTDEAREFDAFITAFEAMQAHGYFLHDAQGTVLDVEGFKQAMCVGMNAIWNRRPRGAVPDEVSAVDPVGPERAGR